VGQAVYAIDAFPDDDLLWRIEWIGGVGCYIRPFRCQIDLLDGGIDDLLDFVGKSSCTSIRALFA